MAEAIVVGTVTLTGSVDGRSFSRDCSGDCVPAADVGAGGGVESRSFNPERRLSISANNRATVSSFCGSSSGGLARRLNSLKSRAHSSFQTSTWRRKLAVGSLSSRSYAYQPHRRRQRLD